jgi:uncharacterized protein (DUF1810 family)
VLRGGQTQIQQVFGSPDDLKFHSCMTLFAEAIPEEPLFHAALAQFFAGRPDLRTLALLGQADAKAPDAP